MVEWNGFENRRRLFRPWVRIPHPPPYIGKECTITVQGDLRDRMRKQTKKEWNDFHRYIAKKLQWTIRIATCRIDGY